MADEKHDPEPTQQTRLRGKDKQGEPYEPVESSSKEATLDALRNAYPEEVEVPGDKLRGDARRQGASAEETEQAANQPPPPPRHG